MTKNKIRTIYRIDDGILTGTEIEPFIFMVLVKYPHRKTPDCYIPPMKSNDKDIKTWHCCQDNCPNPDFEGDIDCLIEHLMLHKGRLIKPWNRRQQLKSPIPVIRLPVNPWNDKQQQGTIADRKICIDLYMDDVKRALKKQGLTVIN